MSKKKESPFRYLPIVAFILILWVFYAFASEPSRQSVVTGVMATIIEVETMLKEKIGCEE